MRASTPPCDTSNAKLPARLLHLGRMIAVPISQLVGALLRALLSMLK
jgi:hypothetical protein